MVKIIFISPFPPRGTTYENKYSALASFTKNKISEMLEQSADLEILVLADQILEENQGWKEGGLEVKRVWKRESFLSYFFLARELMREKAARKVIVEVEWSLFGRKIWITGLLPIFLFFLRVLGKQVFVVCHGVSLDFEKLAPQVGIAKNRLKIKIYDLITRIFYSGLVFSSTKIVVLEKYFSNLINEKFQTDKAIFIPHGVDLTLKPIAKQMARKKLKIPDKSLVLLSFGFLNWYKGSDLLAKIFTQRDHKSGDNLLIFAGGNSFVHKNNVATINKTQNGILVTGFVPAKQIPFYFSAADVVIFPYRRFISSSGPLSLAFSFKKPVVLSTALKGYLKSPDFRLQAGKILDKGKNIFFPLNSRTLSNKINWLKKDNNLKMLQSFSSTMREKRGWPLVAKSYLELLGL